MAITIRDVARAVGVHISTVSRTFSAPHLVNADTRSHILPVAEGLGYRPTRVARALITDRTRNIGMIVADLVNPFFPSLIKAAEVQARGSDYYVFVADSNEDPATEAEQTPQRDRRNRRDRRGDGNRRVRCPGLQRPDGDRSAAAPGDAPHHRTAHAAPQAEE